MKIKCLHVYVDSLLLTNNFNGSYAVKGDKLAKYLQIVKKLARYFEIFSIEQVRREDNAEADSLAYFGSTVNIPEGTKIPITHILEQAIKDSELDKDILNVMNTEDEELRIPIRILNLGLNLS